LNLPKEELLFLIGKITETRDCIDAIQNKTTMSPQKKCKKMTKGDR